MSRIYHNESLSSLPVNGFDWQGVWGPGNYQKGAGTLVEGTIVDRSRQVVTDGSRSKTRYFLLHVKVRRAHRRVFGSSTGGGGRGGGGGVEMEPNFSDTQKVRTGYLHSSYKTAPKGDTDALSFTELESLVQPSELSCVTEKYKQLGCLSFWAEENQIDGVEISNGAEVRLKTRGNGPFVESFAILNPESAVVSNYADRDNVGASWTDKVMAFKTTKEDGVDQSKSNEGAADEEWGD